MGSKLKRRRGFGPGWGRCQCCRGPLGDLRVKATHESGKVIYVCPTCAAGLFAPVPGEPGAAVLKPENLES